MDGGENDVTVTFEYDADGMRTKKTVTTRNYLSHTHSYTSTVTAPTCIEGGYTTYTCECGYSYIGEEIDPLVLYHRVRFSFRWPLL